MITGAQIRAARALLGWSQSVLADAAGISLPTVKRIEQHGDELIGTARTNENMRMAFARAGVEFIAEDRDGGRGVRLSRATGR